MSETTETGTVFTQDQNCPCGQPLPWHLHDLGLSSNTCSCERHFETVPEGFKLVGTQFNPSVEVDRHTTACQDNRVFGDRKCICSAGGWRTA